MRVACVVCVHVGVHARIVACLRARVRACACVRVRACLHACVRAGGQARARASARFGSLVFGSMCLGAAPCQPLLAVLADRAVK
eukprot:5434482-Alexandrium_andersonii.AAC.1